MKHLLITLFTLLQITLIFSQENIEKLSLQQAIDYGLQNNRMVKNATTNIKIAKKKKWETTAIGLPQISASIDYKNWLKQQVSLIDINGDGIDDELVFGTSQTMNASVTASQLLFDGSYLVGLQSAKVYLEISENAKEKTSLEIKKGIINAYGNALLTDESLKILQKNRKTLQQNVFEAQKIYENGLGEQESVEQLQITLTTINNLINNTNRLKKIAYQMLNLSLGQEVNTPIILTDKLSDLAAQNIDLSLANNNNEDISNSIDYKIANNNKRAKELLVKLQKTKALPSLSTFINAGYTGNANQFDFLTKGQRWFGSALFGVNLSIPIFSSGKRSAKLQQAKLELEKAVENKTQTEQQLRLQIATAKSNYQFAIENYNNAKENLRLAERINHKNEIKFKEGLGSSFELHQAQVQLYASQKQYLQAMLKIITEKANLETLLN